jgi:hypothetical protein
MYFEKEKNTLLKVDCNLLTGKYEICKIKAEHKKRPRLLVVGYQSLSRNVPTLGFPKNLKKSLNPTVKVSTVNHTGFIPLSHYCRYWGWNLKTREKHSMNRHK